MLRMPPVTSAVPLSVGLLSVLFVNVSVLEMVGTAMPPALKDAWALTTPASVTLNLVEPPELWTTSG